MNCAKCGAPLKEGQYFCPECWTVVEDVQTSSLLDVEDKSAAEKKAFNRKHAMIVSMILAVMILVAEPLVCKFILWNDKKEKIKPAEEIMIETLLDTYCEAVNEQDRTLFDRVFELTVNDSYDIYEEYGVSPVSIEQVKEYLPEAMCMDTINIHDLSYELVSWHPGEWEGDYIASAIMKYTYLEEERKKEVTLSIRKNAEGPVLTQWVKLEEDCVIDDAMVEELYNNLMTAVEEHSLSQYVACGVSSRGGYMGAFEAANDIAFWDSLTVTGRSINNLSYVESVLRYHVMYQHVAEANIDYTLVANLEGGPMEVHSHEMVLLSFPAPDWYSSTNFDYCCFVKTPSWLEEYTYYEYSQLVELQNGLSDAMYDESREGFYNWCYIDDQTDMEYLDQIYELLASSFLVSVANVVEIPITDHSAIQYIDGMDRYYYALLMFQQQSALTGVLKDIEIYLGNDGKRFYILPYKGEFVIYQNEGILYG